MAYPVLGLGTTIAFGTLGTDATFTAHVMNIDGPTYDRPAIDMSNQSSPQGTAIGNTDYNQTYREFEPGICDVGEISVDIVYNPNDPPPVNEPKEIITFTWPKPFPAATASASFACDGFCTGFEQTTPWEDKMGGRMVLKMSGRPTLVTAVES